MTASLILVLYLCAVSLYFVVALSLTALNLRHVRAHRAVVPPIFAGTIDADTYARSVAYTVDKNRLSIIDTSISALVLCILGTTGVLGVIDAAIKSYAFPQYIHAILCIFAVGIVVSLVDLPLRLYSTFGIEQRYGFNKMTAMQWVADLAKGAALNVVLLTPLLLGLLWFMDAAGRWWWIYAFVFVAGFQILLMFIFPVVVAPLFNKFSPLPDGELKSAIHAMAERVGFKTSGIFVMDGSKRSAHANAYFTGFGKNRRIVLFDTLLQTLTIPQTVAVLAHEVGHAKLHHIRRMLVLSLGLSLIGFWVLDRLLQTPVVFVAFGFDAPSHHAALLLLAFCSAPVTFLLSPLFSLLSRRYEYQSDAFAACAMNEAAPMSEALLALSKKSLANLTPHPWYSFFHYSHPTLFERLEALSKISVPSGDEAR